MFNLFNRDEKEYNYFTTFEEIASHIVEGTEVISTSLKNYSLNSLEKDFNKIQDIEKVADKKSKELMHHLYKDFLPPIEREDIIVLVHSLNTVFKSIADLVARIDIYPLEMIEPTILELMNLIAESSHKLPKLMKDLERFKHPNKLFTVIEEINQINNEGYLIYHRSVKKLYLGESDSLESMKYSKVYDGLNNIMISLERLMDIIEAVIIQNA